MGLPHLIFLKTWIDNHITSKPRAQLISANAEQLSRQCQVDALDCGYTLAELEQEVHDLSALLEHELSLKLAIVPRRKAALLISGKRGTQ